MICSIPTVKSGSTWLDRLRSAKGFPTADGLDLDHFLLSTNNNTHHNSNPEPDPDTHPNSPDSAPFSVSAENRKQISTDRNGGGVASEDGVDAGERESELFGIMSNVLSDLFNMNNDGGVDRQRRKKSLRKQRNPRIFLAPTAAVAAEVIGEAEEEGERSSGGCEQKEENALAEINNAVECEEEKEEESGNGERELIGFSRNEVTVIDTSCVEWKFEKLVYRKRNVWKVREKKGRSKFVGRKRKKGDGGSDDGKKKLKVSNENAVCLSPSKYVSFLSLLTVPKVYTL